MKISVIIPAAGSSSRFGGNVKKPFAQIENRAVFLRTLELFINREDVIQTILAVSPDDYDTVKSKFGANLGFMAVTLVKGGKERWQTVKNALGEISEDAEYVAIHDAVRPCLTQEKITEIFNAAKQNGAAILASPLNDTLKKVKDGLIIEKTVDRKNLYCAQTPQVFKKDLIIDAYNKLSTESASEITDDAQVAELAGYSVKIVESDATNIKITRQEDLKIAQAILKSLPKPKGKGPVGPWAGEKGW